MSWLVPCKPPAPLPTRRACVWRLQPRLHLLQHLVHQRHSQGRVVPRQPSRQARNVWDLRKTTMGGDAGE